MIIILIYCKYIFPFRLFINHQYKKRCTYVNISAKLLQHGQRSKGIQKYRFTLSAIPNAIPLLFFLTFHAPHYLYGYIPSFL